MNLYENINSNLKESIEENKDFWVLNLKAGDKIDSAGAGEVEILDLNKEANYILVERKTDYQPFVAAWYPSIQDGKLSWGQGHYFDTKEAAKDYFDGKLKDSEDMSGRSIKESYNRFAGIEFDYYKDKSEEICAAIEQYFEGAGFRTYNLHGHTKLFPYESRFTVEIVGGDLGQYVYVILSEYDFSFKAIELYYKHIDTLKELRALKKLMTLAMKFKDSELLLNAIKDSKSKLESSVKKEGEYEDIYEEPTDYTEMRAYITALRSICDKAEEDGFNFADKFKKAINDLSDVCADIEDFYEHSSTKED